jgi:hypothetical protein
MKDQTVRLLPGHTKSEEVCVKGKAGDGAMFAWKRGKPVRDLRGTWAALTKAAGVPILLHDFRRSAARNWMREGVSQTVAIKITGHQTDSMFRRYDITAEDDLAAAARKLDVGRMGRKTVTEGANASPQSVTP